MRNPSSIKSAILLISLLAIAAASLFVGYHAVVDAPGRRIIHAYMKATGVPIRPRIAEYRIFMRRIVWGEIAELRQTSEYVTNQQELDAVNGYAWKYSGYPQLYGKYREKEVPEALPPPTRQVSTMLASATSFTLSKQSTQPSTLSPTPSPSARYETKPAGVVYLRACEAMIVRSAPDVSAGVIGEMTAGKAYKALGRYISWYLIDLGDGQSGWVYGSAGCLSLAGSPTLVPTVNLPPPRYVTPTPLCTPAWQPDPEQALDDAQSTLVAFFDLLSKGEYARAAQFYGGDPTILREHNPLVDPFDFPALLQRACEINGCECRQVKRVVNARILAPYLFEFVVELMYSDGSLFVRGPCCGADETQQPPESRFTYQVVLDCQGNYYVMGLPPYMP